MATRATRGCGRLAPRAAARPRCAACGAGAARRAGAAARRRSRPWMRCMRGGLAPARQEPPPREHAAPAARPACRAARVVHRAGCCRASRARPGGEGGRAVRWRAPPPTDCAADGRAAARPAAVPPGGCKVESRRRPGPSGAVINQLRRRRELAQHVGLRRERLEPAEVAERGWQCAQLVGVNTELAQPAQPAEPCGKLLELVAPEPEYLQPAELAGRDGQAAQRIALELEHCERGGEGSDAGVQAPELVGRERESVQRPELQL
eukprot:scaffold24777_cov65-Phaeocystis_antarctica.AAC.3